MAAGVDPDAYPTMLPHQVDDMVEAAQERQYGLIESLARLYMPNVTDDSVLGWYRGDGSDEGEEADARASFMRMLLSPWRPAWRDELADAAKAGQAPEADPLPGLEPRVAAAIRQAYQDGDLARDARDVIYPVYGRIVATAEAWAVPPSGRADA